MRKSLAIIASALLLAVAAATHDRLRYDSTVFADAAVASGVQATRVEYPPCKKGVREDRCIQLYERGVKRSYKRWLASHGRAGERVAAAQAPQRVYPRCRGRNDDRCQQRAGRQARAARPAVATRQAARPTQSQAQRRAATRRAQTRAVARTQVRQQRRTAQVQRQSAAPRTTAPARRNPTGGGTPGI